VLVAAWGAACSGPRSTPPAGDAGGGDEEAAAASVAAPRPVAPVSVSFVTSRRPALAWQLAAGADGARVEMCADRACARVLASFDATGDNGAPSQDLPAGVVFWRLHGTVAGAVGSATSATWELVVPAQSAPRSTAWGAMLDGDGDGFGDVVVGDSDAFAPTQHVYVHRGGAGGPAPAPSSVLSAAAPVAGYASSLASAGDVDGDGYADLLVGSPGESSVYVYRGGPAGFADPPSAVLAGPAKSSFGAAVSGAGDVDGDGYADVVVGAPLRAPPAGSTVQGAATLYYGGPGGLSASSRSVELGPRAGSDAQTLGTFVSTAGDLDGDGLADVAVWGGIETTDPQYVLVYLGSARPFGAAPSALLQYDGATPTWLGHANLLACAGDTNGDGYADLVVSTPVPPNQGFTIDHLSLFFGGPGGPALVPSRRIVSPLAQMDHFGLSVAALDADGDGLDDLAASAASYATPSVSAQLFVGTPAGPVLATTMTTADATTLFERELGSSGDVDGDGYPDLVVGFPARVTPNGDAGILDAGDDDAGASGPLRGAV
ncbi:MAG TPA: FG-GAP-like repeat-containing protein, partial [Polyangiaceae bacterium]|nr:FG-GAP-like repeat-containing protein [Polyangiaceae bacterium]